MKPRRPDHASQQQIKQMYSAFAPPDVVLKPLEKPKRPKRDWKRGDDVDGIGGTDDVGEPE